MEADAWSLTLAVASWGAVGTCVVLADGAGGAGGSLVVVVVVVVALVPLAVAVVAALEVDVGGGGRFGDAKCRWLRPRWQEAEVEDGGKVAGRSGGACLSIGMRRLCAGTMLVAVDSVVGRSGSACKQGSAFWWWPAAWWRRRAGNAHVVDR